MAESMIVVHCTIQLQNSTQRLEQEQELTSTPLLF